MAANLNSLMDRGCWESREFNVHCVHARKDYKLFRLLEFNVRGQEKIRSINNKVNFIKGIQFLVSRCEPSTMGVLKN